MDKPGLQAQLPNSDGEFRLGYNVDPGPKQGCAKVRNASALRTFEECVEKHGLFPKVRNAHLCSPLLSPQI
jgi:hypothetical protein